MRGRDPVPPAFFDFMLINPPSYVLSVLQQLERAGYQAYVVGGCVRDSLMGMRPEDWDVCSDATPEQMLALFERRRVIPTGLKHGTITVRSQGDNVEVTTFRIDGAYSDNRHPDQVSFVAKLEEDLSRRDFTINAMAYNPRRGLVDVFDGEKDLENHTIRCVGKPDVRFHEDGLRILRALRFASRFSFDIEKETEDSIRRNRQLLSNISAERIFKELQGILLARDATRILTAFPEIFVTILPETQATQSPKEWMDRTCDIAQAPENSFPMRLTLLLRNLTPLQARSVLSRLRSDNKTRHYVVTMLEELSKPLPTTRGEMRKLIGHIGLDEARALLCIQAILTPGKNVLEANRLLKEALAAPPAYTLRHLRIDGQKLLALGATSGPILGEILQRLLNEVQEEVLTNEKDALLRRAKELLALHAKTVPSTNSSPNLGCVCKSR